MILGPLGSNGPGSKQEVVTKPVMLPATRLKITVHWQAQWARAAFSA
jgi:hypothetical protein